MSTELALVLTFIVGTWTGALMTAGTLALLSGGQA